MKNILKKGILFLSCGLLLISCDDFLESDPKGRLAKETYFATGEELQMSLNSMFQKIMLTGQANTSMNYAWMADDITTHPQSNKQTYREFDNFAPSDNSSFNAWDVYYVLIKSANFVINNADKTPVEETTIKQAIGQARFWRAYAYYMLVRVFGPMPVLLEEEVNYDAVLANEEEIYRIIIEDLQYAESNLPGDWTNAPQKINSINVYATDGSAKSLLSHVYLSMAGWPLKQQDKYALSRDKAKEVIDGVTSGKYSYVLLNDFAKVYTKEYAYSAEDIIAVYYNKAWGWQDNSMSSLCGLFESAGGGWSDFWGEIKFWKEMPDGARKDAVYSPKVYQNETGELVDWWETWENHPQVISAGEGPGGTEYDYTKGAVGVDWLGEKTHRIFRYSELLLTYAEAQARADGSPNTLAYECVNKVRNRAGLEDLSPGLSGDAFAQAVVAEHGWEVAGYYWGNIACRFFDMQRLQLLEGHFNYRKANPEIEVAPGVFRKESISVSVSSWNDNIMYAPYPARDKALNPNLKR